MEQPVKNEREKWKHESVGCKQRTPGAQPPSLFLSLSFPRKRTSTAVGQLHRVRQVSRRRRRRTVGTSATLAARGVLVVLLLAGPVVADKLCVDVHGRDVVDDAPDLQARLLEEVAEEGGLACVGGWERNRERVEESA